jgi:hypothetical protein
MESKKRSVGALAGEGKDRGRLVGRPRSLWVTLNGFGWPSPLALLLTDGGGGKCLQRQLMGVDGNGAVVDHCGFDRHV